MRHKNQYIIKGYTDEFQCDYCREIQGTKITKENLSSLLNGMLHACSNENGCRCYAIKEKETE